jgi:hypothetical protein
LVDGYTGLEDGVLDLGPAILAPCRQQPIDLDCAQIDLDADKLPDQQDACPWTPASEIVDATGV